MPFDPALVRAAFPDRRVDYYPSLGSTMAAAASVPEHGAIVIAEEQTNGIGRYNRPWHSSPEDGLYCTLVLRTNPLPVLTMAIGLAVQEAIARLTGLHCDIRWPNDLLADGKKCCGILTQWHEDRVLAGIGINVNHASFPPELAPLATSLALVSGRSWSREALLIELLRAIDSFVTLPQESILSSFTQQSSYVRGRRVAVELNGSEVRGVTAGLDPHGYLLLDDDLGRRHTILAGGVRPCS
jgi:BirA family transcriptional regulator, biotin operon repressor / biotin---[acetyl-CoA-carboxylase] ligase